MKLMVLALMVAATFFPAVAYSVKIRSSRHAEEREAFHLHTLLGRQLKADKRQMPEKLQWGIQSQLA